MDAATLLRRQTLQDSIDRSNGTQKAIVAQCIDDPERHAYTQHRSGIDQVPVDECCFRDDDMKACWQFAQSAMRRVDSKCVVITTLRQAPDKMSALILNGNGSLSCRDVMTNEMNERDNEQGSKQETGN